MVTARGPAWSESSQKTERPLAMSAPPIDQPGARRFDRPAAGGTRFTGLRVYTFPGGCATYRFDFAPGASPLLAIGVHSAVDFMPRAALVRYVRDKEGLALCGRGAPCPG